MRPRRRRRPPPPPPRLRLTPAFKCLYVDWHREPIAEECQRSVGSASPTPLLGLFSCLFLLWRLASGTVGRCTSHRRLYCLRSKPTITRQVLKDLISVASLFCFVLFSIDGDDDDNMPTPDGFSERNYDNTLSADRLVSPRSVRLHENLLLAEQLRLHNMK